MKKPPARGSAPPEKDWDDEEIEVAGSALEPLRLDPIRPEPDDDDEAGAKYANAANDTHRRRDEALTMLLRGATVTQVANAVGTTPRTVRRWIADPAFDALYRERQAELLDALHARLTSTALGVTGSLVKLVLDEKQSTMARVNGMRLFFELLGKHKNAPIQRSEGSVAEPETEEDLVRVLEKMPIQSLEAALENKRKARDL